MLKNYRFKILHIDNIPKIKKRVKMEEDIREVVFNIIDHLQFDKNLTNERDLWIKIHEDLQKLGFYYEEKGFNIWEH